MAKIETFDQESMERNTVEVTAIMKKAEGTINSMTGNILLSCSYEKKEMVMEFPVSELQLNAAGYMHGGIIATSCDVAMAALVMHYVGGFPPTVNLSLDYLRPIPAGDSLIVSARVVSVGKNVYHTDGVGTLKSTGEIAVITKAIYSTKIWASTFNSAS